MLSSSCSRQKVWSLSKPPTCRVPAYTFIVHTSRQKSSIIHFPAPAAASAENSPPMLVQHREASCPGASRQSPATQKVGRSSRGIRAGESLQGSLSEINVRPGWAREENHSPASAVTSGMRPSPGPMMISTLCSRRTLSLASAPQAVIFSESFLYSSSGSGVARGFARVCPGWDVLRRLA